jgi:hypothetical protein
VRLVSVSVSFGRMNPPFILDVIPSALWGKDLVQDFQKLIVLRHEPVLPGGTEIARAGRLNAKAAAIAAGVLAFGAAFR